MNVNEFHVTVERGTGWWVAQLNEDPGLIVQTRRLDQIEDEVRDALTLFPELTEAPEADSIQLLIVGAAERSAQEAKEELEKIRHQEAHQLALVTEQVSDLAENGYNYRDIAYLLGISYGRVGQILKQNSATV